MLNILDVIILGKNKSLFETRQAQGYGVKFELSGPRTPQQNGKSERKFQTFFERIRAMSIYSADF
jgi:hypothetical protein